MEYAFYLLDDVTGQEVLEYGSGWGENTILLAHRGAHVHGIDISPELIAINQQRMDVNGVTSGVRLSVASAYEVPCPDASVDVLLGMMILHHLDLGQAAREVYRVLRAGGRGIFAEPVRRSPTLRAMESGRAVPDPTGGAASIGFEGTAHAPSPAKTATRSSVIVQA